MVCLLHSKLALLRLRAKCCVCCCPGSFSSKRLPLPGTCRLFLSDQGQDMLAKVALVTGCSSGLGRSLALALHRARQNGEPLFRVFASARKLDSLKELAAEGIDCVQLDVRDDSSVSEAVQQVLQAAGAIDLLVNNAGVSRIGPLVEQPLSEIQEVLDTNLIGVIRVTKAVAPSMIERRSGLIVMIGSIGSHLSSPFAGAYNASKAALLTLSDTLRLELHPFGIGITFVMAGAIQSSIADNAASNFHVERYSSPASAYRSYTEGIKSRVVASQDPKTAMTSSDTAAQVLRVVEQYFKAGGRKDPPIWFLAGGSALYYSFVGYVQQLFGWPTNALLLKRFGLDKPAPPKE